MTKISAITTDIMIDHCLYEEGDLAWYLVNSRLDVVKKQKEILEGLNDDERNVYMGVKS